MDLKLPPNTPNTRFFEDTFAHFRPALTFCGFDNGGDHQNGYGLKQVIEQCVHPASIEHNILTYLIHKPEKETKTKQRYRPKTFWR